MDAENLIAFIKNTYNDREYIPLHEPVFFGKEKDYLIHTINSTFVSSVGDFINEFENAVRNYTNSKYAIATVNGTSALHVALKLAGVKSKDEVITQSLTFVATCNAIRYCDAEPIFADVSKKTLSLCSSSVKMFLQENCEMRDDGLCWNKKSNKIVRACLPMHTFGFPAELDQLKKLCDKYNICLVEDAAESLGSKYKKKHTGTIGKLSAISFNGNKIITTGGGGMILTDDKNLARKAKHLTTTAKVNHKWDYLHDNVGFNYRLPNINAALGVAQMELLPKILNAKRMLAQKYQDWGEKNGFQFIKEQENSKANYWLNTILTNDLTERNYVLEKTNNSGVRTRPAWYPMHKLNINLKFQKTDLSNTNWLNDRLINLPSSAII